MNIEKLKTLGIANAVNTNNSFYNIQTYINQYFNITLCTFTSHGVTYSVGQADWDYKIFLVAKYLDFNNRITLMLFKEHYEEAKLNINLPGYDKHPNILSLISGDIDYVSFDKPIEELISINIR
jgi:hypothetical protein